MNRTVADSAGWNTIDRLLHLIAVKDERIASLEQQVVDLTNLLARTKP